ncbi:MAG: TPM domain-containing protein [Candidatus Limivicinus sp.]|jgi:uncharacterized protein
MKKRIFIFLLLLILSLSLAVPALAEAGAGGTHIVDRGDFLGNTIEDCEAAARQLSSEHGVEVCIYLMDSCGGKKLAELAEEMFQEGFGSSDGLVFILSREEKSYTFCKFGITEGYISPEMEQEMFKAFTQGEYYSECVQNILTKAGEFFSGIPDTQAQEKEENAPEASPAGNTDAEQEPAAGAVSIPDHRLKLRLVDEAGLLDEKEEKKLLKKLDKLSEKYEADIVAVTVNSIGDSDAMEYAIKFYEENGYGFGENRDGIIYLISMENRDFGIAACGIGQKGLSKFCYTFLVNHTKTDLGSGKYYRAFSDYARIAGDIFKGMRDGRPCSKNNPPRDIFNWIYPILYPFIFLFIFGLIGVSRANKLKSASAKKDAADYKESFNLSSSNDEFISSYETERYAPHVESSDDSGGSSGGSSYTGSYTSSSGNIYSGGSGKF